MTPVVLTSVASASAATVVMSGQVAQEHTSLTPSVAQDLPLIGVGVVAWLLACAVAVHVCLRWRMTGRGAHRTPIQSALKLSSHSGLRLFASKPQPPDVKWRPFHRRSRKCRTPHVAPGLVHHLVIKDADIYIAQDIIDFRAYGSELAHGQVQNILRSYRPAALCPEDGDIEKAAEQSAHDAFDPLKINLEANTPRLPEVARIRTSRVQATSPLAPSSSHASVSPKLSNASSPLPSKAFWAPSWAVHAANANVKARRHRPPSLSPSRSLSSDSPNSGSGSPVSHSPRLLSNLAASYAVNFPEVPESIAPRICKESNISVV